MKDWHADEGMLRSYAEQRVGALQRASIEAHLMACQTCRDAMAPVAGDPLGSLSFDELWNRVQTRLEDAPAVRTSRRLARVGVAEPDRVVVRQIGRQSLQWTITTTLLLGLSVLAAALGVHSSARLGFVLLAPLLPPLGVAAAYRLTPTSTAVLERTSPLSPARLLLWRTAYALATAMPVSIAAGAVIPGDAWMALAWLLPSAACTAIVVAAATWADPLPAAAVVSASWFAIVLAWHVEQAPDAVATPVTQLAALVVAVVAGAICGHRLVALRLPSVPSGKVGR